MCYVIISYLKTFYSAKRAENRAHIDIYFLVNFAVRLFFYYDISFTCKFEIKRTKTNCVGLENTEGKGDIHVKDIFANTAKLHINLAIVMLIDQLKVFNTGFVHPTIEI